MSRGSKVITQMDRNTNRQTHRQMDRQTNTHTHTYDGKHYLPAYAGGNKLGCYFVNYCVYFM